MGGSHDGHACTTPSGRSRSCGPTAADARSRAETGADRQRAALYAISFTITTRTTQLSTIASQRMTCDNAHSFWDIYTTTMGTVVIEMGGDVLASLTSTPAINDGAAHNVVVTRRSQQVR